MLLTGLIVGILSAVALVWTSVLASPAGPPPGSQQNPPPQPPPPHSTVLVIVSAAFFVVGWVTVAVAVARDHLVRRLEATAASRTEMLIAMNDRIAEQMATLGEVGDVRETDAYLNGMAAAEKKTPPDDDPFGRPLRTVPKPRD
jgi:hypothetical protein